jgi:hypothetical protein
MKEDIDVSTAAYVFKHSLTECESMIHEEERREACISENTRNTLLYKKYS